MPSTLEILAYVFSFVFIFWPFVILGPLQRRRHILYNMLVMWSFLALVRILLFFNPQPIPSFLIPEPLNTILFFATGAVLFALKFGRAFLQHRKLQRKASSIDSIQGLLELSPRDFEDMVVEVYCAFGHKAKRTGATGDHGIDVVVQTKKGEKLVIQCKRWRGNVGEPVVRDFYGVMQHEKADKRIIITPGKFTLQAREWAKGKPLLLHDGEEFLKIWERAKAQKQKSGLQIEN
jgi:restriction system protein